jgi:hypothetical protein
MQELTTFLSDIERVEKKIEEKRLEAKKEKLEVAAS